MGSLMETFFEIRLAAIRRKRNAAMMKAWRTIRAIDKEDGGAYTC